MAKCLLFSTPRVFITSLWCKVLVFHYATFPSLLTVGLVYCCGVRYNFPYYHLGYYPKDCQKFFSGLLLNQIQHFQCTANILVRYLTL